MKRIDKSKIYIRKRDLEVCTVTRTGKEVHYVTHPMLREVKTTPEAFARLFRLAEEGEITKDRAQEILKLHQSWTKPKKVKCPDCSRTKPHRHCPECGSTNHVAANCDMEG